MELTYTKVGDYYLPDLEWERPKINRYGNLRYKYLREHKEIQFNILFLGGKLNSHLEEIDQAAYEMEERLIREMAAKQGVTEQLKEQDQMRWVGLMNNIKAAAQEIVLRELIYV